MQAPSRNITPLSLDLARGRDVPLYRQLADQLRDAITDGTLPPGSRLDNEIVLAHRLGISRPTVRRAIQEVVAEGLLARRRGVGTRVAHRRIRTAIEPLGIVESLERDGHRPDSEVLEQRTIPASALIATLLERADGTPVHHFRRLLSSNQAPFAVLTNHVPADLNVPGFHRLKDTGSYSLLRAAGILIHSVDERLISRQPTSAETGLLSLGTDGVILERTRISRDSAGRPVSVGIHAFRGDLIAIGVSAAGVSAAGERR
ncbi:DNA-binding GntR family transcriptional regulator [Mycetocola sp. BIGb0189]|uniref:GntR family transcriptional regulator n=1 Tax=Mycetocola sp. BIGb0189 TaxID=2940604 RepID=UPI00216821CD|nr:GntR family transcriptional regulator [Mycetocola sp. BIGb0189]MCS4275468.1 DNA-binding GntR family transcriptional regulator [Mycetocola sp. BIGb0189]